MDLQEQASMAINAGCQWIEIDPQGVDNPTLDFIIDTCRQAGVILVFHHQDSLLEEKRVHGIKLNSNDIDPLKLRERLGGHPIIGVEIASDATIDLHSLKRADVDYVQLNGYPSSTFSYDVNTLRKTMQEQSIEFPIVVEGVFSPADIPCLLQAGASGFNLDLRSLKGPQYALSLENFLSITALS